MQVLSLLVTVKMQRESQLESLEQRVFREEGRAVRLPKKERGETMRLLWARMGLASIRLKT